MSRSDLLDLISVQDKIANKVRDITGIMLGRRMQVPEELAQPMRDYMRTAVACVAQARHALEELKDLHTGGGGRLEDVFLKLIGSPDEQAVIQVLRDDRGPRRA